MSSDQNSYSKSGMLTFALSMIVSFGVIIYVSFFAGGVDLKEVREETNVAPVAAEAETKKFDVSGVTDPWMSSETMVGHGQQLYVQNCAMCHGNEGKGDGPAGASLKPPPRNLVEGKWRYGGTRLGLMGVLEKGSPGTSMQSYKHMAIVDRWALVHYIRSITSNVVKDDDKDVAAKAAALK